MTQSLIAWHLARDNTLKLAKFCEKHRTKQHLKDRYSIDDANYFTLLFEFDNGGYIEAELRAGDTRSYTVADHFQVVDYRLGK
jgi:hypothetical protein